jgi:hypothetical protein
VATTLIACPEGCRESALRPFTWPVPAPSCGMTGPARGGQLVAAQFHRCCVRPGTRYGDPMLRPPQVMTALSRSLHMAIICCAKPVDSLLTWQENFLWTMLRSSTSRDMLARSGCYGNLSAWVPTHRRPGFMVTGRLLAIVPWGLPTDAGRIGGIRLPPARPTSRGWPGGLRTNRRARPNLLLLRQ